MKLSHRSAQAGDEEFLFALHKATMQQYIVATWGFWDEAVQRIQFQQCFHPLEMHVIEVDGQAAGVLRLQDRTEELFIVTLEILPVFQNQGIGTQVVQQVLREARKLNKPVALQVLKVNLAARALYQRLGFGITGENDTHYILAYELR